MTSLVISGVLLAAMIGIAVYGAVTLPAEARIPVHHGIGSWGNFGLCREFCDPVTQGAK
jgi:hypothetical protein